MLIGAAGAISGVVILYAVNFPRRILLLMFVIPVPAWLVGFLQVGYDIFGAMARAHGDNIAYTVHLAGAALAFLYYHQRWNFGQWLGRLPFRWPPARPRLKVHEEEPDEPEPDGVAEEEVDRILEKIHREGEASLTRKERRILETASREYQRRRHQRPPNRRVVVPPDAVAGRDGSGRNRFSIIPSTSSVTFVSRASQTDRNSPVESNRSAGKQERIEEAIVALRSVLGLTGARPCWNAARSEPKSKGQTCREPASAPRY